VRRFYSFLLVSILFVNVCQAYTVILLNGKQLNGTLLGEDSVTIQLRDPASGVVLSVKKSNVDLNATAAANVPVQRSTPEMISNFPERIPEKSVVEVAREVRAARKGQSRIYTRDDLNKVPEISYGNEVELQSEHIKSDRSESLDESYWRKSATIFRKELASLRERKITTGFSCEKAREKRSSQIYGGNRRPSNLNDAFEEPAECKRDEEIQAQLSDAEWRWDEFTERARKAGVPWQWIE
jgi:hypothetical protein